MNDQLFSVGSIFKLVAMLIGFALGGAVLAAVVGAVVYFALAPVAFYLFGDETVIGTVTLYNIEDSVISIIIAYILPGLILVVVGIIILAARGGLAVLIPIGGIVGIGIAAAVFKDDQRLWGEERIEAYMAHLTESNYANVYGRILQNYDSLSSANEEIAKVAILGVLRKGRSMKFFDYAVQQGAFNPACTPYYNSYGSSGDEVSPKGIAYLVQKGARLMTDREFREQCKERYFRNHSGPALPWIFRSYMTSAETFHSATMKAFWQLGIYLDRRAIDAAINARERDLSSAKNARNTQREDRLGWLLKVLDYIKDDPESRQRALLSQWES